MTKETNERPVTKQLKAFQRSAKKENVLVCPPAVCMCVQVGRENVQHWD